MRKTFPSASNSVLSDDGAIDLSNNIGLDAVSTCATVEGKCEEVCVVRTKKTKGLQVVLNMHEELSCVVQSFSQQIPDKDSSTTVDFELHAKIKGSIELELHNKGLQESNITAPSQFFLQVYDPNKYITDITTSSFKYASDVTSQYALLDEDGNHDTRRLTYNVSIPAGEELGKKIRLLEYHMNSLSSITMPPLLMAHTSVQVAGQLCRVVLRISAASADRWTCNACQLSDLVIAMCVPKDLDGRTAKMSRKGSKWEEIKRLLVWHVDKFQVGNTLEIQAQFKFIDRHNDDEGEESNKQKKTSTSNDDDGKMSSTVQERARPQFHTVVRCSCIGQVVSDIEVNICQEEEDEGEECALTQRFSKSCRLLYRTFNA